MNIAIIDADLIGRKTHRFPNLACMKISGYYKDSYKDFYKTVSNTSNTPPEKNNTNNINNVILKTDYENLDKYDKVFISKVFTDTPIDENILNLPNVSYGGTGFFYDKAPALPEEIEHHMPDYHLYDKWVEEKLSHGGKSIDFKYYLDYSIGFTTRGCFRQCEFCVNKNYKKVSYHSPLLEFVDPTRKKICLLDDNVLGSPHWKEIFLELQATGKPFQFKQGMDERLLTDEKCQVLFNSKYDGDFIFAFDDIRDYDLIEKKLKLLREYTNKKVKFYVFCGYDRNDRWDDDFWKQDLWDLFARIELLMKYHCYPYIMRFNRYIESPYKGIYINIARWCNQPHLFTKTSYREMSKMRDNCKRKEHCAEMRYLMQVEKDIPELAEKYFDMKWEK